MTLQEDGIVEGEQKSPGIFVKNGAAMAWLVGTGDNFWAAMYFAASTLGAILAYALVQLYYVKRFNVYSWWHLGLLLLLCMTAGVTLPGGLVVLLWHLAEKRRVQDDRWDTDASTAKDGAEDEQTTNGAAGEDAASAASVATLRTTRYGCRPKFQGNVLSQLA
jgi:type VI protein secretion system component VasK